MTQWCKMERLFYLSKIPSFSASLLWGKKRFFGDNLDSDLSTSKRDLRCLLNFVDCFPIFWDTNKWLNPGFNSSNLSQFHVKLRIRGWAATKWIKDGRNPEAGRPVIQWLQDGVRGDAEVSQKDQQLLSLLASPKENHTTPGLPRITVFNAPVVITPWWGSARIHVVVLRS